MHRDERWEAISKFAEEEGAGTQAFLQNSGSAVDLTAVTNGVGMRIEVPGIRVQLDIPEEMKELKNYLEAPATRCLYESPQDLIEERGSQ